MNRETSKEIFWLSADGEMYNPLTKEDITIDQLSSHSHIISVVPVSPAGRSDITMSKTVDDYGFIAIVETDL